MSNNLHSGENLFLQINSVMVEVRVEHQTSQKHLQVQEKISIVPVA